MDRYVQAVPSPANPPVVRRGRPFLIGGLRPIQRSQGPVKGASKSTDSRGTIEIRNQAKQEEIARPARPSDGCPGDFPLDRGASLMRKAGHGRGAHRTRTRPRSIVGLASLPANGGDGRDARRAAPSAGSRQSVGRAPQWRSQTRCPARILRRERDQVRRHAGPRRSRAALARSAQRGRHRAQEDRLDPRPGRNLRAEHDESDHPTSDDRRGQSIDPINHWANR